MANPVSEYICSTESIMAFAAQRLKIKTDWTVYDLQGSLARELIKLLPDITLPAAVITYTHSQYGNFPRRAMTLSIVVCVDATFQKADLSAIQLSDEVIRLLDNQTLAHAHYEVNHSSAISIDRGIISRLIEFTVKDN